MLQTNKKTKLYYTVDHFQAMLKVYSFEITEFVYYQLQH